MPHPPASKQDVSPVGYLQNVLGPLLAEGLHQVVLSQPADAVTFLVDWLRARADREGESREDKATPEPEEKKQEYVSLDEIRSTSYWSPLSVMGCPSVLQTLLKKEEEAEKWLDDLNWMGAPEWGKLIDLLMEMTYATGAYLCKEEQLVVGGEEKRILRYVHVSSGHEAMLSSALFEGEGVTWRAIEEISPPDGEEDGDEKAPPPRKYQPLYISDVLSPPPDASVKFVDMRRPGSFLALPVVYESCLIPSAVSTAVENLKIANEAPPPPEEPTPAEKVEGEDGGEEAPAAEEEEVLAGPTATPLPTEKAKLVLCLDTMGQTFPLREECIPTLMSLVDCVTGTLKRTQEKAVEECAVRLSDVEAQNGERSLVDTKKAEGALMAQQAKKALTEGLVEGDDLFEIANLKAAFQGSTSVVGGLKKEICEWAAIKVPQASVCRCVGECLILLGYQPAQVFNGDSTSYDWESCRLLIGDPFFEFVEKSDPCGPRRYADARSRLKATASRFEVPADPSEFLPASMEVMREWVESAISLRRADVTHRKKLLDKSLEPPPAADEPAEPAEPAEGAQSPEEGEGEKEGEGESASPPKPTTPPPEPIVVEHDDDFEDL